MDDAKNPAPRPLPGPPPEPPSTPPPEQVAASPTDPSSHTSRRWFLGAGAALVVGAGAGIGGALLRPAEKPSARRPVRPPAALTAALEAAVAAERALLADLDATTGGAPAVRRVIVQAKADHAAHLQALRRVLASLPEPAHRPATHRVRGTPRTQAQLHAAEQLASAAAAHRAARLDGPIAALLASIAACEATHAELLL